MAKHKKIKKKNQPQLSSIEGKINSFLSKLGIKKSAKQYKDSVYDLFDREGINHEKIIEESNAFSPERHDLYFTNIETAVRILTSDYKRFFNVIKSFNDLNGFPINPQKICDIGSGPAVISLWLAQNYPESHVTAIDHSENALNIGKIWANDLGIKNIDFKHDSYEKISLADNIEKYDFIFGTAFLDLDLPYPSDPKKDSYMSLKEMKISCLSEKYTKPIKDFILACSNLISESGLIYLDIRSQNELGLLTLLSYLKEYNLGVDWNCTTVSNSLKKCSDGPDLKSIHLFLHPGLSSFIEDPWEEWLSLMLLAEMDGEPIALTPIKFESYFNLLSKGTKILEATLMIKKNKEYISIFINSGLLVFFKHNLQDGNRGIVYSAGAVYDILGQFNVMQSQAQDLNITYLHPLLSEYPLRNR